MHVSSGKSGLCSAFVGTEPTFSVPIQFLSVLVCITIQAITNQQILKVLTIIWNHLYLTVLIEFTVIFSSSLNSVAGLVTAMLNVWY